ncbi:hypothetical protein C8R45DRAFT_570186 [Mycena sanguinolenta]|nr:hypothetical protein C8R45DRAFT_570186 [Mycena sanguinolenta]
MEEVEWILTLVYVIARTSHARALLVDPLRSPFPRRPTCVGRLPLESLLIDARCSHHRIAESSRAALYGFGTGVVEENRQGAPR